LYHLLRNLNFILYYYLFIQLPQSTYLFAYYLNCNILEHKRPKKVIPKPLQWKANVRKEKRNSGQEYTTRKNKVVPRRKMKPPCEDKCRLHCNSKFTEIERQTIFEEFWAMGDIEKQRHYILKALKTVTPKYRYVRADATCNRSNNQAFYLKCGVNSENIRVCKYFFMATLDITIKVRSNRSGSGGGSGSEI